MRAQSAALAGESSILPLELDALEYAVAGRSLIRDISARLVAGGASVILGPNGAGKSLTLLLAHGLLEPTGGRVRWGGVQSGAGRAQAMVFERPVLLRRSAVANVEYALALRGAPRAERAERAAAALARTGLSPLANRGARVLSAGEQQRLALARAWATEPEVLFLDEPTASLDPAATRQVEALIEAISAAGTKIIMTTHDMAQARRLATDVLFLHAGRLLEHTPAARVIEAPQSHEAPAVLAGELFW
jgi:tungstate transport system ATP-binding protein